MLDAAVDNDVLIKLAAYVLLEEGIDQLGGPTAVGVLGASHYVVPSAIERHDRIVDKTRAKTAWLKVADCLEILEPSEDELNLATAIEEEALRRGLPVDVGESQLFAMLVERSVNSVVTGDKRAIVSAEVLMSGSLDLGLLANTLVCLEQLVVVLIDAMGDSAIRASVCRERLVDRALATCMGCASLAETQFDPTGLESYISDLRTRAPSVLATVTY